MDLFSELLLFGDGSISTPGTPPPLDSDIPASQSPLETPISPDDNAINPALIHPLIYEETGTIDVEVCDMEIGECCTHLPSGFEDIEDVVPSITEATMKSEEHQEQGDVLGEVCAHVESPEPQCAQYQMQDSADFLAEIMGLSPEVGADSNRRVSSDFRETQVITEATGNEAVPAVSYKGPPIKVSMT